MALHSNSSSQASAASSGASSSLPASAADELVGNVAPTTWQQVRSVLLKNGAMAWTEKKSWLARLLVLLVMIAMVVLFGITSSTSGDTQCPQGFVSPYAGCDDETVRQYLFGYGGSSAFAALDSLISSRDQGVGWWQPAWLSSADSRSRMRYAPTFYVAAAASNATNPLLQYDIGWGQTALINATGRSATRLTDWNPLLRSTGLSIPQQALSNQQQVAAHATITPCRSNSAKGYWSGWLLNNGSAQSMAQWLYPDTIVYVLDERVSGSGDSFLRYELSSYTWEGDAGGNYWSNPTFPLLLDSSTQGSCQYFSPSAPPFPYAASQVVHGLSNALMFTAIQRFSSYPQQHAHNGSFTWLNSSRPLLAGSLQAISDLSFVSLATLSFGILSSFLVFPSLLLLPWFTNRVIYEREEQLYYMMRIAGLRISSYWLGNYLCDSLISWLWSASLLVAGYASGSSMFNGVSAVLWLLLYAAWIHAQLGVAWFVALFFTRRRLAAVVLYMLVIVLSAFGFGFSAFLFSRMNGWPWYLSLFPPLTFIRAMGPACHLPADGGTGAHIGVRCCHQRVLLDGLAVHGLWPYCFTPSSIRASTSCSAT